MTFRYAPFEDPCGHVVIFTLFYTFNFVISEGFQCLDTDTTPSIVPVTYFNLYFLKYSAFLVHITYEVSIGCQWYTLS